MIVPKLDDTMKKKHSFVALEQYHAYSPEMMQQRAREFCEEMQRRRSVRTFSSRPFAVDILKDCIAAAGAAPSGANNQPWYFIVVSDASLKKNIREEAEKLEFEFYTRTATDRFLQAVKHLEVSYLKPFLEEAPCLIVIFQQLYGLSPAGERLDYYYVRDSVGIATGTLITAIHHAGLVCLPYTPPNPFFLNEIFNRPENERAYMIIPVGFPAENTEVPDLQRKSLADIAEFV